MAPDRPYRELHGEHGLGFFLWFVFDLPRSCIEAPDIQTVHVHVLERVVEFADGDGNLDGLFDIQQAKICVRKLNVAPCAHAIVDRIED